MGAKPTTASSSLGIASTTISSTQGVHWMWKSNNNPWDTTQTPEWKCYSDAENTITEGAYQANESYAILDNYKLNFSRMVQIANNDSSKKRPVKRVTKNVENSDDVEEATPLSVLFPVKTSTVNRPGAFGDFIWEAYLLGQWRDVPLDVLVETAAQGIIEEGKKIGKQTEAEMIASLLLEKKHSTRKQIWQRCASLYSMESFLYKTLNQTLRLVNSEEHKKKWRSRLQTLGLFAWFLFDFPQDADEFEGYLYRGDTLDDVYIASFKTVAETGELLAFPTFMSTSRNRSTAEWIGNTLFIISIARSRETSVDLSDLPNLAPKEGHLLIPGFLFKVTRVEFDSKTKKHLIYLQDCNHQ